MAAAAGHVNMMDDVLISNLPPVLLRSALRTLVSQGATTQRPFVQHVRNHFLANPPGFPAPTELFPAASSLDNEQVSQVCLDYVASTRCIFSSKLAAQALPYLTHFITAIPAAKATWSTSSAPSSLSQLLATVSGDIVQAVQALKEPRPIPTDDAVLLASLQDLLRALADCASYCHDSAAELSFPFTRADRQVRDVLQFLYPAATLPPAPPARAVSIAVQKKEDGAADVVETFAMGPCRMPRLLNGLWQLSSPAWGSGSADSQERALAQLVEAGLSAADMADHYGDAELIYGDFRNRLPAEVRETVYAATKWCIFGPINQPVTRDFVLAGVRERARRLGGRVDLLQFHWHDYSSKEYLDILVELVKATKTHPELVSAIGLCNFDAEHMEEACKYLLEKTGEVGIVSNQVQFSLVDARPLQKMCAVCDKYGIKLLTYGSFCGGFISSKWLGADKPEIYSTDSQLTPSQRKYFDMVQTWGSWEEFQALLKMLGDIAQKHGAEISLTNVATRWVLQQPAVGAVIVGTRLGVSSHAEDNLKVFQFQLDAEDMEAINTIALGEAQARMKAKAVFDKLGDCGNEYRAMH